MSTLDREQLKTSFGADASGYHAGRHSYPSSVAQRVLTRFRTPPRALEIGCGSGQATSLFLPYCSELVAVDLSAELLRIAARDLAGSRARFLHGAFEDIALPQDHFDLVFSAQAFHWLNLEIGLPKAAAILRASGSLALFWNFFDFEGHAFLRACRAVIFRHVPEFAHWPDSDRARFAGNLEDWRQALERSSAFVCASCEVIASVLHRTPRQFHAWLGTCSWVRTLAPERRAALCADLDPLLQGEQVHPLPLRTMLLQASRR
jgi:SAM-dependent methyltransferase